MRKRLMLIALFLSLVLFAHTPAVDAPATAVAPNQTERKILKLEVVYCPEATLCVMNVVGETGLLGRQVAVWVGSYQAPSAYHYGCRLERIKGKIAATFLQETLRNAEYVFLVNAHKKKKSPYLAGTLLVDGRDVTTMMFELKLAVPRGIKVDWCEKISRRLEV